MKHCEHDQSGLAENGDEIDGENGELICMDLVHCQNNPDDSDDDLDPTMHSGFLFVQDSESEDEIEIQKEHAATSTSKSKTSRLAAVEERSEYQELKSQDLTFRPDGCSLGIHPGAQCWRAYGGGSKHYGRCFGHASGRTAKQALLRVIELMLEGHLEANPKDKMAKGQLKRVQSARAAEPAHKD